MKMMKKNTKRFRVKIFGLWVACFLALSFVSCSNDPSDSPFVGDDKESTVLIYAVATNSLSSNLVSDKMEMLQAASNIDLSKNNVLIFETKYQRQNDGNTTNDINLIKLVKNDEGVGWETVKEFNDGTNPLQPSRITEVINFVHENFEADNYGLVFWSHSTGSQPYITSRSSDTMAYSFGQDLTASDDLYQQINVKELAEAIPSGLFDYIWFDSCYMSNIETIYEFRNKCNTYVGYATEVMAHGLPYDLVLPYMVGKNPDLTFAADAFYNYYSNSIATIAVMDMSKIEDFAENCKEYLSAGYSPSSYLLMDYSRNGVGPFYDLGDYVKSMAELAEIELTDEEWDEILNSFVIYKAATAKNFSGITIDQSRYSGISTHLYKFNIDSLAESYYQSLDWFKEVF